MRNEIKNTTGTLKKIKWIVNVFLDIFTFCQSSNFCFEYILHEIKM